MSDFIETGQPNPNQPPHKVRFRLPWWVALLAIGAVLLLCCGGGYLAVDAALDSDQAATLELDPADPAEPAAEQPEPEPAPEPTTFELNQPATLTEFGNDIGTITITEIDVTTDPAEDWGDSPQHGHYVMFTVELAASRSMAVFSGDFYVVTADGERVDEGNGHARQAIDDAGLGYAELNADEHRTGVLVFDLAEPSGQLAYDPNYDTGPIAFWAFDES
jgi:hypothetical protein